jgi:hypothetical protein
MFEHRGGAGHDTSHTFASATYPRSLLSNACANFRQYRKPLIYNMAAFKDLAVLGLF